MEETNQISIEPKNRPTFLTVLCILTFIGSGLGLLFGLLGIIAAGAIEGLLESIPGMQKIGGSGMAILVLSVLLSAASLFGAILMWQLRKIGFYIYVAAQIIALAIAFSIGSLIFTALFIVLYYLNFKHLE